MIKILLKNMQSVPTQSGSIKATFLAAWNDGNSQYSPKNESCSIKTVKLAVSGVFTRNGRKERMESMIFPTDFCPPTDFIAKSAVINT